MLLHFCLKNKTYDLKDNIYNSFGEALLSLGYFVEIETSPFS